MEMKIEMIMAVLLSLAMIIKSAAFARAGSIGNKSRVLIVACEPELEKLSATTRSILENDLGFHILISGVGKINAAKCAMFARCMGADIIVNVGTAGSHVYGKGTLVIPNQTAERDMDATDIMRQFIPEFPKHLTPFEESVFRQIDLSKLVIPDDVKVIVGSEESPVTCWTGDNTHAYTEKSEVMDGALIEMEGAAITAIPCKPDETTILIKSVSDDADENVGEDWAENADGIPWDTIAKILKVNFS
jgi:adenosylhomocysteine nucleosidase